MEKTLSFDSKTICDIVETVKEMWIDDEKSIGEIERRREENCRDIQ